MKLNKRALKQVVEFWFYLVIAISYSVTISVLAAHHGLIFLLVGLVLPVFLGLSYLVYSQSEVFDDKT